VPDVFVILLWSYQLAYKSTNSTVLIVQSSRLLICNLLIV